MSFKNNYFYISCMQVVWIQIQNPLNLKLLIWNVQFETPKKRISVLPIIFQNICCYCMLQSQGIFGIQTYEYLLFMAVYLALFLGHQYLLCPIPLTIYHPKYDYLCFYRWPGVNSALPLQSRYLLEGHS